MRRPLTLSAFTDVQKQAAHVLLATRVAFMMGRKLEEADWSSAYCLAKGIPECGWSNLNIDVMFRGLGVEHKMLRVSSDAPIKSFCGTSQMHPSATRSIRIASVDARPDDVMRDVLTQYGQLLLQRKEKIREDCPSKEPDLRTGWLLWQSSLTEFLYFEEEAIAPDPNDYFSEWRERAVEGAERRARTFGYMNGKPEGNDTRLRHRPGRRSNRISMCRRQTTRTSTCSACRGKRSLQGLFASG